MKYFLFALLLVCFVSLNAQENKRYINITGTSELILPADQMTFTVQIKTINDSIEESKKANDNHLNELISLLKSSGIISTDITTSPITLGKNYVYKNNENIQKGFYTEVTVSFLLKDLSKYYELTNKLSSSNSSGNINSNYNISDYELQNKLAYQKALKTAKEKAEYMASTMGVKLGDILEIDETTNGNNISNYPNPFNTVTVIDSPNNNSSGKVTIKRSVRVKFAIL
ncbi:MAG: SIMPL domain-containing protein [Ignavibacteriaceae bacterium]|nr:SIMPL domain-containing protein [Ignavibacteriaceae bacterium]